MDILWFDDKYYWINPYLFEAINYSIKKHKKRFIIISLIIIQSNINHQNLIIFDTIKLKIERFDPYGYINNSNTELLDKLLTKVFKKLSKKIKYISPKIYMNRIGFQNISEFELKINNNKNIGDPNGFCIAWCFWYLETRLKNPNIKIVSLINNSIKYIINSETTFTEYIRSYSVKLFNILKKYLNDSEILYLNKIDFIKLKKIYKEIYKSLSKNI